MTGDEQVNQMVEMWRRLAFGSHKYSLSMSRSADLLERLNAELTATQNVVAQYAEGESKLREEVESLRTTITALNESLRITSEGNFKLRERLAVAEKERDEFKTTIIEEAKLIADQQALFRQYLTALKGVVHAPNSQESLTYALEVLATQSPTDALNKAIAEELERMADELVIANNDYLRKRADELRGKK